jgi:hypothetical protein
MHWVIAGAAVLGYVLYKKSQSMTTTSSVSAQSNSGAPPVQSNLDLATLQKEILALIPKPVDPLAPKTSAASLPANLDLATLQVMPSITSIMPAGQDWTDLQEAKARESNLNPRDFDAAHHARYTGEIKAGHTLAWNPTTQSFDNWEGGYQPGNALQLVGQGSQLALQTTSAVASNLAAGGSAIAGSIGAAIPFVGIAVSGLVGLFSAISRHHAQAVQAENTAYNNSLVTVENYMAIIKNAVLTGQSTPDEGINALDSMYKDFLAATPAPLRNNSPYCNGLCEAKIVVNAMVEYWKDYFNRLIIAGKVH